MLLLSRIIARKRHKGSDSVDYVGWKVTGRINPAIGSFLAECQSRERLRLIDAHPPIAQAHILARPCKSPGSSISGMTVLSIKKIEGLVDCVCGFCMILPSCLLFQLMKEKESVESRK